MILDIDLSKYLIVFKKVFNYRNIYLYISVFVFLIFKILFGNKGKIISPTSSITMGGGGGSFKKKKLNNKKKDFDDDFLYNSNDNDLYNQHLKYGNNENNKKSKYDTLNDEYDNKSNKRIKNNESNSINEENIEKDFKKANNYDNFLDFVLSDSKYNSNDFNYKNSSLLDFLLNYFNNDYYKFDFFSKENFLQKYKKKINGDIKKNDSLLRDKNNILEDLLIKDFLELQQQEFLRIKKERKFYNSKKNEKIDNDLDKIYYIINEVYSNFNHKNKYKKISTSNSKKEKNINNMTSEIVSGINKKISNVLEEKNKKDRLKDLEKYKSKNIKLTKNK